MKIVTKEIKFRTKGHTDIVDLSPAIRNQLTETELSEGQVNVFAVGSTTGITTVEYEPGLVESDLAEMYQDIAPYGKDYSHNKTWGDDNGAAHLRSSLTGSSANFPFIHSKLVLGTWQQIVFLDFDTRPRDRRVVLQFIGV